ncbi:MAG: response regulator, partial [Chloroflexota bacterium]
IMMSMANNKSMGFSLGADAFIEKPLNRGRLLELVNKHVALEVGQSLSDARVMVVEDADDLREMMRRTLNKEGITVIEAANGRDALNLIAAGEKPSLILLDLMMPKLDGFQVVEALRTSEDNRNIPIVVVTAKELTEEDRRRLNGGIQRILQKGAYSRDQLLQEVSKLTARYVAQDKDE